MKYLRLLLCLYAVLWIVGGIYLLSFERLGSSVIFLSYFIFNGVVIIIGVLFEKKRYKPNIDQKDGWILTKERFIEPDGKTMAVYYHPKTGERKYQEASEKIGGTSLLF